MIAACPFPANRGTPARILRMAETLVRRGHEVHVATYGLAEYDVDFPFAIHRIPSIPTYRRLEPGPSIQKLLLLDPILAAKVNSLSKKLCPDVIHAHHFEGLIASLPAQKRYAIPVVFDVHVLLEGEIGYYRSFIPFQLRNRLARALDHRLPGLADRVVTVSEEIRDALVDTHAYDARRITVATNGVEPHFFFGIPDRFPKHGKKRILFTGNFAAYQGTDYMLVSLAKVIESNENVELLVATSSDPQGFLEKVARAGLSNHVRCEHFPLEDLPDLIASADVALNPRTQCPGVPQKLLNYMAGGAPIISFAGSAKHLEHGVTGFVVENGDATSFGAAIVRLLEKPDLARKLGNNAQTFARENLTWEKNAALVESVYASLLSDG
jgi:glycosyltransferase involved in cell wall biosynthesis